MTALYTNRLYYEEQPELTARIELATSTLLVLRYATKLGEPHERNVRSGGIEPPPTAWKAAMIPFHHERVAKKSEAIARQPLRNMNPALYRLS